MDPRDKSSWIEISDSQWKAEVTPGFRFHFNLCRQVSPVHHAALGKQQIPVSASHVRWI